MNSTKEDIWNRYFKVYRDVLPKLSFFEKLHKKVINLCQPHNKVLDAGCGPGLYFESLLERGKDVYGIDLNKGMVKTLKKRLNNSEYTKNHLIVGNVEELPYENDFFDAVININVLYAVQNPSKAIREMYRVTKPGGALIIAGPNPRDEEGENLIKKQVALEAQEINDKDFLEKLVFVMKVNEEILDKHVVTEFDVKKITNLVLETGYKKISHIDNTIYMGQCWLLKAEK